MFLLVINMYNFLNLFSKKPLHHLAIYKYLDSEDKCLEAIRDSGVKQWLKIENEFTVQDIFKLDNPGSQMIDYPNSRKIGDASGTTEFKDNFPLSSKIILDAIVLKIKIDLNLSKTIDPEGLTDEQATELTQQKELKDNQVSEQLKKAVNDYSKPIINKIQNLKNPKQIEITGEQTTQAKENWFVAGLMAFLNAIAYVFSLIFCCHQPYEKVSP